MPNNENVNRTKADERIRRAFSKMSHMLGSILNGLKHKSSYYAATYFCITKIITHKSRSELILLLQPTIFTIGVGPELQFQKIKSLLNKTIYLKHNFCLS